MNQKTQDILTALSSREEDYARLEKALIDPQTLSSPNKLRSLAQEEAAIKPLIFEGRKLKKLVKELKEAEDMLAQETGEMKDLAESEVSRLSSEVHRDQTAVAALLSPPDPQDTKNAILEIRAGTGGEEAALFAEDLRRMYSRFAERRGWRVETLELSRSGRGGLRSCSLAIEGKGCYGWYRSESGVHRVQRIPQTESGGRIHTSAATVAVMPEVEEVEVDIQPADLRIDTFCSSGPGGQSVNTTYSAVRIVHVPTGLTVSCQDEKSQIKNKAKALRVLRARLRDKIESEKKESQDADRRTQIGSGDRSEKIRTYNYPQNRVTDHRVGLSVHEIERVMDGNLDTFMEALRQQRTEPKA